MPVVLVADQLGLREKNTLVPTGMIWTVETEKVVVRLLLTLL
jgi:hypothetical protein